MRKINFKVRNVGSEKYLSYILDDETDFDEELLDYLDENKISELIDIIYEEDDENDYFTYNITDRTTVAELLSGTASAEMMLGIIRGVATGIVNMRDLGIPVAYVILNKNFTYVNPVTYDVKLICIPVESDISLNAEFKAFVKDLIFSAKYSDKEDCNYVARLINMLNVEKFTMRGFVGQITELMESAGMQVEEEFMDVGDSGVEVSKSVDVEASKSDTSFDDLPEVSDISFSDDEDGLEMYEEEPETENTIFKDLDLDAEESTSTTSSINMDVFDESNLEELEIDEDYENELDEETSEDSETDAAETEVAEADEESEKKPDEELEAYEDDDAEAETDEQEEASAVTDVEENASDIEDMEFAKMSDDGEAYTETLTSMDADEEDADEDIVVTEVARTADGVTEIVKEDKNDEAPVLIDTEDIDNLIDKPPVVKNIRINRAKIIQKAVDESESEETIDNPTEQIIGTAEPEAITTPVSGDTEAKETESSSGTTVELTAGMNVVKDTEPEAENSNSGAPKAMPYIVRVDTGERVMINKAVFKLGKATRGVDFTISGNGAISKVHAIIYQREDGCYLKDNKATNPTYVDGVKLEENQEVKLKNDSTIIIGGEDFLFKLS